MISNFLHILESGGRALRSNARLMFIVVLLFVFPLLLLWVIQLAFLTTRTTTASVERQSISQLHDSISIIADDTAKTVELFSLLTKENQSLREVRVIERIGDEFRIIGAADESLIGSDAPSQDLLLSLPLGDETRSVIVPLHINDVRLSQAFRKLTTEGRELYIFSEHNYQQADALMNTRQQKAYISVSVIIIFLLAFAYWIHRQDDWARKHRHLQSTLAERDQFTNMIAHEFRTPLTAIKGYASFLEESEKISADERTYAKNIYTSAQRLVVLVNDFLEVARIQSGKLTLTKELLDIESVITTVCDQLRPIAKEHNLDLIYHHQQTALKLHADKNRLTQILTNIITNSLKYTEHGHVEVAAIQSPKNLIIKVMDTGKGISADDQRQLFRQFTRVGGADRSGVVGSGLGMWITKQLVELMGGTIGVESIEGIGTHVIISFPH